MGFNPSLSIKRAGIDRDDQLQLKVRNDALVLEKISFTSTTVAAILDNLAAVGCNPIGVSQLRVLVVSKVRPVPLTGAQSIGSLTIVAGVVTGAVLFVGFFLKRVMIQKIDFRAIFIGGTFQLLRLRLL